MKTNIRTEGVEWLVGKHFLLAGMYGCENSITENLLLILTTPVLQSSSYWGGSPETLNS